MAWGYNRGQKTGTHDTLTINHTSNENIITAIHSTARRKHQNT